ncbi:MAG: hypothetical protein HY983_01240 [Candidatus Magasanikbacteria bacterium]|nr:hypothetical protein [Candidatus Magasanikbacteria bacterium]
MLQCGFKLWSSNDRSIFAEAFERYQRGEFAFIELYNNPAEELDFDKMGLIKEVPTTIHNTHSHGWHEFDLQSEQMIMWQHTLRLADFFESFAIIVHPGRVPNFEIFQENLLKIDDPRIYLENMAGLDIQGKDTYGRTLKELQALSALHPICFDLEKAVKSACFQKLDYHDFITNTLKELRPTYFHISGGDKNSPVDEHRNLWEANFDVGWIHKEVYKLAEKEDVRLVFETPKIGDNLGNDLENMDFFGNS